MNNNIKKNSISLILGVLMLIGVSSIAYATPPSPPPPPVPTITRTLTLGSTDAKTGGEVTLWQNFLFQEAKGPRAEQLRDAFIARVPRGYFGKLTGDATVEWQEKSEIIPSAPAVGPKTRAALLVRRELLQGGIEIVYPNGGEMITLEEPVTIRWKLNSRVPKDAWISFDISGVGGGALNIVVPSTSSETFETVFSSSYRDGEPYYSFLPEKFKLSATVTGKKPCTNCLNPIIASDQSDTQFTFVANPAFIPHVINISSSSGKRGTFITLTGSFTRRDNNVHFIKDLSGNPVSATSPTSQYATSFENGSKLSIQIPEFLDPHFCLELVCNRTSLGIAPQSLPMGEYRVSVVNVHGRSNEILFTVTE